LLIDREIMRLPDNGNQILLVAWPNLAPDPAASTTTATRSMRLIVADLPICDGR
jgi:hypothetical protein